MKRVLLAALLLGAATFTAGAQQFALIDTEYILERMPAYAEANNEIEAATQQWQAEVEAITAQAKTLYEDYQATASTLTDAQRTQREQAIVDKEKEAAQLRADYFGPDGELARLQDELLGPIEDSIYEAVKAVAKAEGYAVVFDRASDQGIIYASPAIDISNQVLAKLGN